ncbi:MAG: response regulator [Cyanobacteria bacterium P01_C01_bin.89]
MSGVFVRQLFVVEDNDQDFLALERIIKEKTQNVVIRRFEDGDEALDWVEEAKIQSGSTSYFYPALVLLDLNLPGTNGREVLEVLKHDRDWHQVPVVIFTTSQKPDDIEYCYENGANSYLVKPLGFEQLRETVQAFLEYWLTTNVLPNSIL